MYLFYALVIMHFNFVTVFFNKLYAVIENKRLNRLCQINLSNILKRSWYRAWQTVSHKGNN